MKSDLANLIAPKDGTRYVFFGGKGGVGKTTAATATAVWFADQGLDTTIVSTDPTVSLSVVFGQPIGGERLVPINDVPNLRGLNINPHDATGVFQKNLNSVMGQAGDSLGPEITSTPCAEEMATFDQFVSLLDDPGSEVIVFDTAPTGKTLRELAMPFDWAGFMKEQISEGKKLAAIMNLDESSFEALENDKRRYDNALRVLGDRSTTIFNLVLLPERLPIEESASAISGLDKLGIPVQALVVNQCILPENIQGNRFLSARADVQSGYQDEIESRFPGLLKARLPLLDHDVSDVAALRELASLLYDGHPEVLRAAALTR